MSQKRSLTGFLVASLGLAAALAVFSSPDVASAAPGDKSTCSKVKAVCDKHGSEKDKIVQAMKDAVSDFKKKATTPADKAINCKSCHNEDNSLKANAVDDFNSKLASVYK